MHRADVFESRSKYIRKELEKFGYDSKQIESNIIPILIIRNKIDVGHTLNEISSSEEIAILRKFVARSVKNIGALLRNVAKKIASTSDFLDPLKLSNKSGRTDLIKALDAYLEQYLLEPASKTQRIVSIPDLFSNGPPFTIPSGDG